MEPEFRPLDPLREAAEQRALFRECFPETIGTPVESKEHYAWKFHSPRPVPSPEFGAYAGNELIGYYAAVHYPYRMEGRALKAAMVCDVMTGAKARGKGVFTRLGVYSTGEFAKLGFDFSTGYPIRPEVIPGHLKAGWEDYFPLPMYGRFLRFDAFLKDRRLGFLAPAANALLRAADLTAKLFLPGLPAGFSVEVHDSGQVSAIAGLDEFFLKWREECAITLEKSAAFLRWRLGAPGKSYHVIVLRHSGAISGYAVCRPVIKEGVPCLGVLDMILLKGYHRYGPLLSGEIFRVGRQERTELVLFMINSRWHREYRLRKSGFMKTPFTFHFILKLFNRELPADRLKNPDNWHLTWIDSDDL